MAITVKEFTGMDNVARQGIVGRLSDGSPAKAAAKIIHNLNVTTDMKLVKRDGFALWCSLPGAHSIFFDGAAFLCAATGSTTPESLYRVTLDRQITELCPINGLNDPLSYVRANGLTYISSRMWNGVLDNGSIRSWGAEFGDDSALLDDSANSEEMMLLNTSGPPCMENLCMAGGRIFGTVDNRVHYNDPSFALEMFRPDSFHEFSEPLVMIAVANEGFYFAGETRTWFAPGYDPTLWKFDVVGDGAIGGSLQIAPRYKQFDNVPMWLNKQGVQAGIGGSVQQITQDKVRFNAAGRAASVYRQQNGGQYISNFIQPPDIGFGDSATCEVVRNGKLIT